MVAACDAASKQEEYVVLRGRFVRSAFDLVWFCKVVTWWGSGECRFVTFICGRADVCALGAVVAKHAGDEAGVARYLSAFKEVITNQA